MDILASTTLFARGFVSMHQIFVFDTIHGRLDRFLELSIFILGQFGKATKILILSDDQR